MPFQFKTMRRPGSLEELLQKSYEKKACTYCISHNHHRLMGIIQEHHLFSALIGKLHILGLPHPILDPMSYIRKVQYPLLCVLCIFPFLFSQRGPVQRMVPSCYKSVLLKLCVLLRLQQFKSHPSTTRKTISSG